MLSAGLSLHRKWSIDVTFEKDEHQLWKMYRLQGLEKEVERSQVYYSLV